MNLKLEVGDEISSSEYEEGEIISQDPNADMTVKEGYTIKVNISKGKAKEGTIPNIVSKTRTDAEFVLQNYGYDLGNVTTENSDMPKDVVIRQTPEAGTEADPGTKVDIVISLGNAVVQVEMPNLMGKDIDTAQSGPGKSRTEHWCRSIMK